LPKEEYILLCPKCESAKTPEWVIGTMSYSAQRLDVPYFMCGDCRLIYVDKAILRRAVSEWRNNGLVSKRSTPPYKKLCEEMFGVVNRVVEYYCRTAGYKRCRFRKVAP